jgi:hypothetical protein
VFPPQTDNFQKPIKFKSDLGNEFFGKNGEKPSEEKPAAKESTKPKPKPKPFHCEHYERVTIHLLTYWWNCLREVERETRSRTRGE